ncbi:hypothetical protein [Scytonema sp. HK-05]|uniref:hypothetical protein n=1 Tax=Scytonema sp. HK-05 TaxID=1137095 RepID=UPI001160F32D|nr:hypothetical protein [Scytonema sp. HK-05]
MFGFRAGVAILQEELQSAIATLGGQPTSNLSIILQKDIKIGSRTFPKGLVFNTGLDVEKGGTFPLGLNAKATQLAPSPASP